MADPEYETHDYDVIIIGAGGSGLRAAIEAKERGLRVALVCKSLLGKAHTVMAEGGMAAAMGHVWPEDNWQVHFRDTMRGGKMLNNWRMAELHAKEAPDRVRELEDWGALFDRTKDGLITQRDFGGHRFARLAHVGDRTGLEMIRTLQQKVVALQQEDAREHGDAEAMIKVFAETTITRLVKDGERIAGALTEAGYVATTTRVGGPIHGVQICQHHCPVSHVAEEFPELCETERQAMAEVLGTHVQRLATIVNGDCACTTHVPLTPAPSPRPHTTSTKGASV